MEIKAIFGAILTIGSVTSSVLRGFGKGETADAVDACVQAVPELLSAIAGAFGGLLLFKADPKKK